MPNQHTNNDYLNNMGIVTWTLRQQQLVYSCIQAPRAVLTLVADIAGHTSDLQQKLWENIVDAVCHPDVACDSMPMEDVIVFGERALQKITAQKTTVTHSLAELIAQPQYKANVWHVIKHKIAAAS